MANIAGYEIETPQEVMARINEQINAGRASGDPNAINAANSQAIITSLFGTPETRKAEKAQNALTNALKSVEKKADESEEQFQIRQQVAVRNKMAGVDPNVALQANDKILAIQSEEAQRNKLNIGNQESQLELDNAIATTAELQEVVYFRRNSEGDLTSVGHLGKDATDEEISAEQERLQEMYPDQTIVVGNGTDRLKLEDIDLTSKGGIPGSGLAKIEVALDTAASLMNTGVDFVSNIDEAPLSLAPGSGALSTIAGFGAGLKRIAGEFFTEAGEVDEKTGELLEGDEAKVRRRMTAWDFDGWTATQKMGTNSAIAKGLVLNMAYKLAKSLDSGGRLSDQDVDMAIQMLTGNGDPVALKTLFRSRFSGAAYDAQRHKKRAESGGLNGAIGLEKYRNFEKEWERMQEALDEFDAIVDAGGLAVARPELFGKTSVEGDGQGSTNKPKPKIQFTLTPK